MISGVADCRVPKSWVTSCGPTDPFDPSTTPTPTSRNELLAMFSRWPGGLCMPPGPTPQSTLKPAWPYHTDVEYEKMFSAQVDQL